MRWAALAGALLLAVALAAHPAAAARSLLAKAPTKAPLPDAPVFLLFTYVSAGQRAPASGGRSSLQAARPARAASWPPACCLLGLASSWRAAAARLARLPACPRLPRFRATRPMPQARRWSVCRGPESRAGGVGRAPQPQRLPHSCDVGACRRARGRRRRAGQARWSQAQSMQAHLKDAQGAGRTLPARPHPTGFPMGPLPLAHPRRPRSLPARPAARSTARAPGPCSPRPTSWETTRRITGTCAACPRRRWRSRSWARATPSPPAASPRPRSSASAPPTCPTPLPCAPR